MNRQTTADGNRFTPTNPCLRGILKLFSDEKTADVVFEVNGQEKFYAHRLILQMCAPALAEYCDGAEDNMTSVLITNVEPDILRYLLYYVYGGTVPGKVFSERSRDIIDAADRFGVGNLKVEAEGWYVKLTPITLENFVENLHFSDTKKCALLKESVMDFLVHNELEALNELSKRQDAPQSESMLADFLTASARKKRKRDENHHRYEFKTLSVDMLRKKLDERGSDVDGTREMLMTDLEKCCKGGAIVEGAGTPEINGFYDLAGKHDGISKYKKSAMYHGKVVEFILVRGRIIKNTRRWITLIVSADPVGGSLMYAAQPVTDTKQKTPPRDGWECVEVGGMTRALQPPPTVYVKESDIQNNATEWVRAFFRWLSAT